MPFPALVHLEGFSVGTMAARLTPREKMPAHLRPPTLDMTEDQYRATTEEYDEYSRKCEKETLPSPRRVGLCNDADNTGDNSFYAGGKGASPRTVGSRVVSWRGQTRPGDWWCPRPECGAHNYNLRTTCYRCHGTEKVFLEEFSPTGHQSSMRSVSPSCPPPPPPESESPLPSSTLLDPEIKRWEVPADPDSTVATSLMNSHPAPEWGREAWREAFETGNSTYVMRSQVEVVTCERNVKQIEVNQANLDVKIAAKRAAIARMAEELKGLRGQKSSIDEKLCEQRMELYMAYKKSVTVCKELLDTAVKDCPDIPVLRMELELAKNNLERVEHQVRLTQGLPKKRSKKRRSSRRSSVSPDYSRCSSRSSSESSRSRSRSKKKKKSSRSDRRRRRRSSSRDRAPERTTDKVRERCEY